MTETKYYAFYENGNYVEKTNLQSITTLSGYGYLIQRDLHHEYTYSNNHKYYYQYKSIDINGNENTIIIGDFECLQLGIETGFSYYTGTICKVLDKKRNTIHDLDIGYSGIRFFYKRLIPILIKLNDLGTWESYQVFLQNERLLAENKSLLSKLEILQKEIETLKAKS